MAVRILARVSVNRLIFTIAEQNLSERHCRFRANKSALCYNSYEKNTGNRMGTSMQPLFI